MWCESLAEMFIHAQLLNKFKSKCINNVFHMLAQTAHRYLFALFPKHYYYIYDKVRVRFLRNAF